MRLYGSIVYRRSLAEARLLGETLNDPHPRPSLPWATMTTVYAPPLGVSRWVSCARSPQAYPDTPTPVERSKIDTEVMGVGERAGQRTFETHERHVVQTQLNSYPASCHLRWTHQRPHHRNQSPTAISKAIHPTPKQPYHEQRRKTTRACTSSPFFLASCGAGLLPVLPPARPSPSLLPFPLTSCSYLCSTSARSASITSNPSSRRT